LLIDKDQGDKIWPKRNINDEYYRQKAIELGPGPYTFLRYLGSNEVWFEIYPGYSDVWPDQYLVGEEPDKVDWFIDGF